MVAADCLHHAFEEGDVDSRRSVGEGERGRTDDHLFGTEGQDFLRFPGIADPAADAHIAAT